VRRGFGAVRRAAPKSARNQTIGVVGAVRRARRNRPRLL